MELEKENWDESQKKIWKRDTERGGAGESKKSEDMKTI